MILKFLIISFILFYIIFKLFGFFFKILLRGSAQQQQYHYGNNNHQKKPSDGNVTIDYIPKDRKNQKKAPVNYKGGDYIDYEEVK
ncbi:MAG: DUF4834 family protein [Candidatus Cyclobacteriaceae bacterium M2_1C_046]